MPFGIGDPPPVDQAAVDAANRAKAQADRDAAAKAALTPRVLSDFEQKAIINSIGGHAGWFVVGQTAVPETRLGTNQATGASTNVPTGSYTITLSDGQGHTEPGIVVTPGATDENGQTAWTAGKTPTDLPKPVTASSQAVNVPGVGLMQPNPANPSGPWIKVVDAAPSNPDDDITKAVARQRAESERNEREANAAAGNGYMTSQEVAAIEQRGQQLGQSQQQIDLEKQKFEESQKQFDLKQKLDVQTTTASVAEANARAGLAGAQTGQVSSATEINAAKAPGEIAQTAATTAAQTASAAANTANAARTNQQIAQGNAPTVENIPTTSPNIYQRNPQTGALTSSMNTNFMPTTQAEVASRVSQLQQSAQAQRDLLMDKQKSGAITADQAAQQFDSWWSSNVEPQKAALDAAQRTAQLAETQKTEESNRANYATAQQAGQTAVQAQQALLPYMVGPGFGAALNNIQHAYATGTKPGDIDIGSAVTFQMPDMQALAKQATDQALAHISPTAAQGMSAATGTQAMPQMGQQPPQGQDVSQQLNRTNYTPTTTVAPDGTVTVSHQGQPPPTPSPQIPQHPFYGGLQQGYGAAPQQDFRGLAQGGQATGLLPYRPMSATLAPGEGLS